MPWLGARAVELARHGLRSVVSSLWASVSIFMKCLHESWKSLMSIFVTPAPLGLVMMFKWIRCHEEINWHRLAGVQCSMSGSCWGCSGWGPVAAALASCASKSWGSRSFLGCVCWTLGQRSSAPAKFSQCTHSQVCGWMNIGGQGSLWLRFFHRQVLVFWEHANKD